MNQQGSWCVRSMKRRIHLSESFTYRHQFYQQTLTLIETNAPENFVKSGVFYYCNDENNTGYTVCDSMDTLQNVLFAYYHFETAFLCYY